MGAIRLLILRRAIRQPLRSALVVLAVAAGVALAVGVLIDQASLSASVANYGAGMAGRTAFRVTGPTNHGGLDQAAADRLAGVDGVAAVVPVVQAVSYADDSAGHSTLVPVLGVDCRVE